MSGTSTQVPTSGGTGPPVLSQVPLGTLLKSAAADTKTTNILLLVVVLCMSGLMPDQLTTLCGAQVARWSTGVKRVAGKVYRVIKRGGAWLIMEGSKLLAMFIRNVVYTFSREVGKRMARRIFAA